MLSFCKLTDRDSPWSICCKAQYRITTYRVRKTFGRFQKAMEIDDASFQDLESFGKRRIFLMVVEKVWVFWDILKCPKMVIT